MKKLTIALLLASAGAANAGDFNFSGFATVTAGKAFDGWQGDFVDFSCPCFIGNYEHGATYEKNRLSLAKESLIGLQGKYQFTSALSGTVQVVGRASENGKPEVDWAYLSYDLSPETTVQVGRRRLPIYAYSDSVYVGYTLPWVRVPQDIYGWEVGAYNGANISHTVALGDWAVRGNLFAGQEVTKDNIEMRKIYYGYKVDDSWKHILGGYLDVSNDIFGARLMYMQNSIDATFYEPGQPVVSEKGVRQRIIGLSASLDYQNWMVRAEANSFIRPVLDYKSKSWTATVGYRWGNFTPMIGYSSYKEKATDLYTDTQNDNTRFVGLRWDFRKNMDLKLQFDSVRDSSSYSFTHDAKMATVTLDVLF
jgi:hypothetical protein